MIFKRRNCVYAEPYAYALNRPHIVGLKLGRSFSRAVFNERPVASREYFAALAENDGLIPIKESDIDPTQNHNLAVFGHAGFDMGEPQGLFYDVFRLNKDGVWSFRPGAQSQLPTHSLRKGVPLTTHNLKREYNGYISRGDNNYPTFGGFFKIPEEGLVLQTPGVRPI